MKIELAKDRDGYTAMVAGRKHLFAFGYTRQEALEELASVGAAELENENEVELLEKKVREALHKIEHGE